MQIAVTGMGLLGGALLVHLAAWRIRLPQNHTAALLGIFTLTPLVVSLLARPASTWEVLHVALFYASCALVYIILYSLIEEESPTLALLAFLNTAPEGCTKSQVQEVFADKHLLEKRLAAMMQSGLLARDEAGYTLTRKGYGLATLFACAARVTGLEQGG